MERLKDFEMDAPGITVSPVVRKVSISETLDAMEPGTTARFTVRQMNLQSVRSRISRRNLAAGRTVFVLTGYNNGEVFDVTRKE